MKLPENKQERMKIFGLIGVGICGALYAVWAFVYQPILEEKAETLAAIENREDELSRAETMIRRSARSQSELDEAIQQLAEWSEAYMLHPRLGGNYLLQAREIMARHTAALGLTDVRTEEVGLVAMPRPSGATHTMQAYAMRVQTFCGYDTLKEWFRAMEEENPFVVFSQLLITSRPDAPTAHQVSFEVQWPVWIEPGLRQQLLELSSGGAS